MHNEEDMHWYKEFSIYSFAMILKSDFAVSAKGGGELLNLLVLSKEQYKYHALGVFGLDCYQEWWILTFSEIMQLFYFKPILARARRMAHPSRMIYYSCLFIVLREI